MSASRRRKKLFARKVRSFIASAYTPEMRAAMGEEVRSKQAYLAWHKALYKQGWVAPHWPTQYGGTGWNVTQRYIFNEENARAETTPLLPFGLSMGGPVIFTFGNGRGGRRPICRASCLARTGGARAIQNPAPALTWQACAPARSAKPTTTSSTARRPGRRWPNMPTGSSASSAPIRPSNSRKAFRSCSST